jgi:hypothetical protein
MLQGGVHHIGEPERMIASVDRYRRKRTPAADAAEPLAPSREITYQAANRNYSNDCRMVPTSS